MSSFVIVGADTIPQAYRRTLKGISDLGALVPCQGRDTREVIGATIRITDPRKNICLDRARRFNYRYMVGEMMWNLCPRADVRFLQHLSKGIGKFVEDQPEVSRDKATWAYGPGIAMDLAGVVGILQEHPESRRAVLRPGRHSFAGDRQRGTPPCLEVAEFLLRDGLLHMVVFMRSNDAYLGMPYDMFTYTTWQQAVANALGVGLGTYTHDVGSLHYYIKDQLQVDRIIKDFDESAGSIDCQPNMLEAGSGALHDDINTALADMENVDPEGSAIPIWKAKSWAPLLNVVTKDYHKAETTFATLSGLGVGIGW